MARYPTAEQWQLFELYRSAPPPMSPLQFLQQWELDYPTLARVAGVSRSTIEHWFSQGKGSRIPAVRYCRRLAIVHFLWSNLDLIPPRLLDRWQQGQ